MRATVSQCAFSAAPGCPRLPLPAKNRRTRFGFRDATHLSDVHKNIEEGLRLHVSYRAYEETITAAVGNLC